MKILHLPFGLPMTHLCRALRSKGIESTSCHFYRHHFNFPADISLNLQNDIPKNRIKKLEAFLKKAIQEYDIFHFHFGETFLPDKSDLKLLANANKKMIVHHHGSEVRSLSIAKSFNNPYVQVKPYWTEEKIGRNLKLLSQYIDHAIVQDYELFSYVEKYYKQVHVIANVVDISQFRPFFPDHPSSPLVVHAPSNRELKGTEFVLSAVDELKKEGFNFQFRLIENMPHDQARKIYMEADIVIDQLRIGAFGSISTEAMALGKPVICYIRDDLMQKYAQGLPIVNATPVTIKDSLKYLLQHPGLLSTLGKQGRNYVEHYHSSDIVARDLIEIYSKL